MVEIRREDWFDYPVSNMPTIFKQLIEICEPAFVEKQEKEEQIYQELFEKLANEDFQKASVEVQVVRWVRNYNQGRLVVNVPSLFRESVFLMQIAFLEDLLIRACLHISNQHPEFESFSNKKLDGAKEYIKNQVGISISDEGGSDWAQIKKLKSLRNVFSHRFGRLDLEIDDRDFISFVNKREDLAVDDANKVWMDRSFLEYSLGVIERFLKDLDVKLRKFDSEWQEYRIE